MGMSGYITPWITFDPLTWAIVGIACVCAFVQWVYRKARRR
jgi:hypothetical protein